MTEASNPTYPDRSKPLITELRPAESADRVIIHAEGMRAVTVVESLPGAFAVAWYSFKGRMTGVDFQVTYAQARVLAEIFTQTRTEPVPVANE